jgi:hypothetical protein
LDEVRRNEQKRRLPLSAQTLNSAHLAGSIAYARSSLQGKHCSRATHNKWILKSIEWKAVLVGFDYESN